MIALVGPSHLGKKSFVQDELQQRLADQDILVVDHSINGARDAISFGLTAPLLSALKIVLVDDADKLSEPAQDAYLKFCEETPPNMIIILVMGDDGCLLPAMKSRIRKTIKWSPLSPDEIREYAKSISLDDEASITLCGGRPGLYESIHENKSLAEFDELIEGMVNGSVNSAVISTPKIITDLPNKPSLLREAISMVCSMAVKRAVCSASFSVDLCRKSSNFLRFASTLIKIPTTNAEIYWQEICLLSM